jgi:hypothetical protein
MVVVSQNGSTSWHKVACKSAPDCSRASTFLHDAADDLALREHVAVVLAPTTGWARDVRSLEDSWPMSAPVLLDYTHSGGYTEREKDRTRNKVTQNPGDTCAEERQGDEQSKVASLGVHSCLALAPD